MLAPRVIAVAVTVVGPGVGDMDDLAEHELCRRILVARPHRTQLTPRLDKALFAMGSSEAELLPFADQQHAVCGVAERMRLLQYCLEHRREVTG